MTNFLQTHGNPRKGTQWEPRARRPTGPGLTCFTPGRSMSSGFPPPTRLGLLDGRHPLSRSARIKRIQEQRRFQTSTERVQLGQKNRTSPHWFGKTVPTPSSEEKVIANNPVPKFDLLATQLLEITTDYRASSVFLQSLSEEASRMLGNSFRGQKVLLGHA